MCQAPGPRYPEAQHDARRGPGLRALDRDPYTGHAVLLGRRQCPGQDTGSVSGRFAARPGRARLAYRAFVDAGIPQGRRSDLQGAGLVRSLGGGPRSTPSGVAESTTRRRSGCSGVRPSWRHGSPACVWPCTSLRPHFRGGGVGALRSVRHGRGSRISRWMGSATRHLGWMTSCAQCCFGTLTVSPFDSRFRCRV
jgi:hypothetical protein